MNQERLLLSRPQLQAFLACQRRFQLRYLSRLPWPKAPLHGETEAAVARGQQFHQLVQRYFLDLPVEPAHATDPVVRRWWGTFLKQGPRPPAGTPLAEITLTVPVGQHLLHGRFDLLIVGGRSDRPFAHLFDWKTGRTQTAADLRRDWQTRLYLALLAEGGQALLPGMPALDPVRISMTYWYVSEPESPRTIQYGAAWHERNWAELMVLVAQLEESLARVSWPKTEDLTQCRLCAYQAVCGRQAAGTAPVSAVADDEAPAFAADDLLQPDLP